jgi:hypothetical protein
LNELARRPDLGQATQGGNNSRAHRRQLADYHGPHCHAHDVKREQGPEQWPGHALDETPDQIARAQLIGKASAFPPRVARAHMSYDRRGDLNAPVPRQAQPERQVHIFDVAEKPLIEAAGRAKGIGADETCCGTWCEDLAFGRQCRHRPAMAAAPGYPGGKIMVACAVEFLRVCRIKLRRAQHERIRMTVRGRE